MECPSCGALVPEGMKFCKKCGERIIIVIGSTQGTETKNCPNCGTPTNNYAKFCRVCGASLPARATSKKTLPPPKTESRTAPIAELDVAPAKLTPRSAVVITTGRLEPVIEARTIPEGICPSCGREMVLQKDRKKAVVFVLVGVALDIVGGCLCFTMAGAVIGIPLIAISIVFYWGGIAGLILAKRFIYICPNCSFMVKPPGRAAQDAATTKQMLIVGAVMIVFSILAFLCVGGSCASMFNS
jgi:hypothetical protein